MTRVGQLVLVLAAAGLWVASRMTWVVLESADGLGPPRTTMVSGATWAAALVPVAGLLLAAALAPLAVRGWALRTVALLIAVVSAGVAYMGLSLWMVADFARYAAAAADVPIINLVGGSERQYVGASLTLVAAVGTLFAAVLLLRSAVRAGAAPTKYAAPATRREVAAQEGSVDGTKGDGMSERMIWDALDEGRDPTLKDNEGR
jgi:uncharacterized membrane protein (TIGR02234 family)